MPIAPELKKLPEIIGKFNRAGMTSELINALIKEETNRDLVEDARRLMVEFGGDKLVNIQGLENIPRKTGCLVVFNHPNMDVLLPALLSLMVKVHDNGGHTPTIKKTGCLVVFNHPNMDVLLPALLSLMVKVHDNGGHTPTILMGGEIPLLAKFNDTYPLPGSIKLINKFHRLYPENIISVPISTKRKDYHSGRFLAIRKTMIALKNGNMVVVSPEGHVEKDNVISPIDTLHSGSGGLSIMASNLGIPVVPVGIWEMHKGEQAHVNIGKPFFVKTKDKEEAVCELMYRVSQVMPEKFRGQFEWE